MAKPTIANAAIATAANFSTGPETGTATKIDGGATVTNQGLIPGTSFIGQWFNHKLNQFYQWCQYLDNLHGESAFLSQAYTWTGQHKIDSTAGATDPQWNAARTHARLVPLGNYTDLSTSTGWYYSADLGTTTGVQGNTALVNLFVDIGSLVPSGSTILQVDLNGLTGTAIATSTNRFRGRLLKYTNVMSGNPVESLVAVTGGDANQWLYTGAASAAQSITMSWIPTATQTSVRGRIGTGFSNTFTNYVLQIRPGNTVSSGNEDKIFGISVTYSETTVNRNF